MKKLMNRPNITLLTRIAALGALAFLSISVSPAYAATLSRSVDVSGTLSAVWSMIGPFCAIKDWLRLWVPARRMKALRRSERL
jgi:hypothetical protein